MFRSDGATKCILFIPKVIETRRTRESLLDRELLVLQKCTAARVMCHEGCNAQLENTGTELLIKVELSAGRHTVFWRSFTHPNEIAHFRLIYFSHCKNIS
jgi:uncharacterized metal-binding protein